MSSVHAALRACGSEPPASPDASVEKPTPAQVRRSIQGEHLISFEDGRAYKFLKRHLAALDMTPADYRRKWSLPADYPMVAPDYARRRSEIARRLDLGRQGSRRQAADGLGLGLVVFPRGSGPLVLPSRFQPGDPVS